MTVELRTGTVREARQADYITKSTAVAPGGDCPRWMQFLGEITNGDEELQAYLKRVAGYCLTGSTREHVLFFLHGTGANGKSVFVNTLVGIWGDYAVIAPMETFVENHGDRHPTELAKLCGARLVVAQETEQDRRWAESKIKALTGGDRITARFMRQDFFEFVPQFKLMIAGNHKPSLRGVDEAIRRRMHLIPFAVTIPVAKRDPRLAETLRDEWGGILEWAVEGCLEWQEQGLNPPAAVVAATQEYLNAEDSFARWAEEYCEVGAHCWEIGDDLWRSWSTWAERGHERVGSRKGFVETLKKRGYMPERRGRTKGYQGIMLRHDREEDGTSRPLWSPGEADYGR